MGILEFKKQYKYLIWDWNGTLLNDIDICVSVMNRVLSSRKLPLLTIKKYKEVFGFPVRDYYKQLGFDFEKEPFENISMDFINEYQNRSLSATLAEDCISMLNFCKNKGIRQVILSASQISNLEEQVRHFEIIDYFDKLLGLDNCHASSKVEVGKKWMDESKIEVKDVLLIGDTIHDYEAACEMGCDCVLLTSGHQSRERVSCLGVPIIDTLKEVRDYLSNYNWECDKTFLLNKNT